jgi:hypothetical protein
VAGVQGGVRHAAHDGRVGATGGDQLAVEVECLGPAALCGQACRQHVAGVCGADRIRAKLQGPGGEVLRRCEGVGVEVPPRGFNQQPRRQRRLTNRFQMTGLFLGRGAMPRQHLGRAPMQRVGLGGQQGPDHSVADEVVAEAQPSGDPVDEPDLDCQLKRLLHRSRRLADHLGQQAVEAAQDRSGRHDRTASAPIRARRDSTQDAIDGGTSPGEGPDQTTTPSRTASTPAAR